MYTRSRRRFSLPCLALATAILYAGCAKLPDAPPSPLQVDVWHGSAQRIGHLGSAQPDFNLMGRVRSDTTVVRLAYRVNDGALLELTLSEGPEGFRRLAGAGAFNADIPIDSLTVGPNVVRFMAEDADGRIRTEEIRVFREVSGEQPLPVEIDWSGIAHPQDVGQIVDGKWFIDESGYLRTAETGYDRLFLIGNDTWVDYEAVVHLRIHSVDPSTTAHSGPPGVGLILRFMGHTVGPPFGFPDAQPKWGYKPFGAILWARWHNGPDNAPFAEFYPGDQSNSRRSGMLNIQAGTEYTVRVRVETTSGASSYHARWWPAGDPEPSEWTFGGDLAAGLSLDRGGLALVAHHADVGFGPITVEALGNPE